MVHRVNAAYMAEWISLAPKTVIAPLYSWHMAFSWTRMDMSLADMWKKLMDRNTLQQCEMVGDGRFTIIIALLIFMTRSIFKSSAHHKVDSMYAIQTLNINL
jgi:hypothetical protein